MSYDFEIWSQKKLKLTEVDLGEGWIVSAENIRFESKNWQISCDINVNCELEDVPEQINPLISGISYLNSVYVHPISAPKTGITKAKQLTRIISNKSIGAILDKQTEKITLPTGYKKYRPVKLAKDKRISVLNMVWYMKELPFKNKQQLSKFIDFLQYILPEALPKRYGTYEPPEYNILENGLNHFKDFLYKYLYGGEFNTGTVLYPKKPVVGISFHSGEITSKYGRLFPYVKIEFDANILTDNGWNQHLKTIWKQLSCQLNPFYGEARLLKNAIASRTNYCSDFKTEHSPTRSGFWMGIPQVTGLAIVMGVEYSGVWKTFDSNSIQHKGLNFVESKHWNKSTTLYSVIGRPPIEISQQHIPKHWMDWNYRYPQYWPFGDKPNDLEPEDNKLFENHVKASTKKWWQFWR